MRYIHSTKLFIIRSEKKEKGGGMEKKRDKMKDYMKAKQVHMGKKNCCLFFNFLYVIKTL